MSSRGLAEVIARVLSDAEYARLMQENPYDLVEREELTPEEQSALVAASESDLVRLGVPESRARAYVARFRVSQGGGG